MCGRALVDDTKTWPTLEYRCEDLKLLRCLIKAWTEAREAQILSFLAEQKADSPKILKLY